MNTILILLLLFLLIIWPRKLMIRFLGSGHVLHPESTIQDFGEFTVNDGSLLVSIAGADTTHTITNASFGTNSFDLYTNTNGGGITGFLYNQNVKNSTNNLLVTFSGTTTGDIVCGIYELINTSLITTYSLDVITSNEVLFSRIGGMMFYSLISHGVPEFNTNVITDLNQYAQDGGGWYATFAHGGYSSCSVEEEMIWQSAISFYNYI